MTDAYLARWLRHADRDLHVAENELHTLTGDVITEAVCFHAQQAVEKYLKGYLVAKQIKFPRTHNLELLLELCGADDPDFSATDVTRLSFYAVEIRYPDEFLEPSLDDATESVRIAQGMGLLVRKKLTERGLLP